MCVSLYNLSGVYLQPQKGVKIEHSDTLMLFTLLARPDSVIFLPIPSLIMNFMKLWKEFFSWLRGAKASSKFIEKKLLSGLSKGKQESIYHYLFF